jgi:hypothetical protein
MKKEKERKIRRSILIKRWKAESPDLFKKILNLSLTLGGIGAVIIATPILAFALPVASTFITIGATGAVVSKFTVKNSKELEK